MEDPSLGLCDEYHLFDRRALVDLRIQYSPAYANCSSKIESSLRQNDDVALSDKA